MLDGLVCLQHNQADASLLAKPGIGFEIQCLNHCRSRSRRVAHGYIIASLPVLSQPSCCAKNEVPFGIAGSSIS